MALACALPALAQVDEVVKVDLKGYSVAGLVTHAEGARQFKYGVALFPGYPGILKLAQVDGKPQFELGGNFLVRSRRHWLDAETMTVVVDAPSDQWASFDQMFRARPRYGADVRALLDEVARRFPVGEWTFVGTSEGTVSAYQAARMNPPLARRVILSSSELSPNSTGPGLAFVDWSELKAPLLWVHHEADPCQFTSYREAQRFAQRTKSPLVTVRGGGEGRGGACQAFTAHGFVGIERETVLAMRSWIKTGAVPADVGR